MKPRPRRSRRNHNRRRNRKKATLRRELGAWCDSALLSMHPPHSIYGRGIPSTLAFGVIPTITGIDFIHPAQYRFMEAVDDVRRAFLPPLAAGTEALVPEIAAHLRGEFK